MKNINLTALNDEELIKLAEEPISKYEVHKNQENVYEGITLKDMGILEQRLQRTVLSHPRGMEVHNKVKEIYDRDSGAYLRTPKQSNVKSTYEVLKERNGCGRYGNTIR